MRHSRTSWLAILWAVLAGAGCGGCGPSIGTETEQYAADDGGESRTQPPRLDAGDIVSPQPDPDVDGGTTYSNLYPAEECASEAFTIDESAPPPDGSITVGLCAALRTLTGVAKVNDKPVSQPFQVEISSSVANFSANKPATNGGNYLLRALRSRYDRVDYHPSEIFPTHNGPQAQIGGVDLTQDQQKDLFVTTHTLSGTLRYGGSPWTTPSSVPDVQLGVFGSPGQSVSTQSQTGTYSVSLIEGKFGLGLSIPREALGDTEVFNYLASPSISFGQDTTLDIAISTSALEAQILLDGEPLPDRQAGYDYALDYYAGGGQVPSARSRHAATIDGWMKAEVPRDIYGLGLSWEVGPDHELPSLLDGKMLTAQVDLNHDTQTTFALNTFRAEGSITVDGQPVKLSPNAWWNLYAVSYGSSSDPGFLAYYQVPLDRSSFSIRMFPGIYFLAVYIDESLLPDLAGGWYYLDRQKIVSSNTTLPINIITESLEGNLTIDRKPAKAGELAGTMYFQHVESGTQFRRRIVPLDDGLFHLRLPKGKYNVWFEINPTVYEGYAVGRQRMGTTIDLNTGPKHVSYFYDTTAFAGPIRLGGEVVNNTVAGPEVGLGLRRQDQVTFHWSYEGNPGGSYVLRVPRGEYDVTFEVTENALPDVAGGSAPMGIRLKAP